jgi:hypothetical protein
MCICTQRRCIFGGYAKTFAQTGPSVYCTLGYKDFNNLVVLLIVAKSNYDVSIKITCFSFFFSRVVYGYKENADFDADLESVEKLQKIHAKKVIDEKVIEKCFFSFSNAYKSFRSRTFLLFFQRIPNQHQIMHFC